MSGDNFRAPQKKYHGNIKLFLGTTVLPEITIDKLFVSIQDHDLEHEIGDEDLHSFQVRKAVTRIL